MDLQTCIIHVSDRSKSMLNSAVNVKGVLNLVVVELQETEDIQSALRRFKKKCIQEGIPQDIRRTAFYEKPSVRKRNKHKRALKRIRRKLAKFHQD